MKVAIAELAGGAAHLAGATNGQQHAARISGLLSSQDQTVLLDFSSIESATSSYLKALLFGFFDDEQPAAHRPDFKAAFPVVVRLKESVREELAQLMTMAGRQVLEGVKVRGEEILVA